MSTPKGQVFRRTRSQDGASAVEYGLLVALIAAVIVIAVFAFGGVVKTLFHQTCSSFTNPGPISGSCQS
ncbi:MAG: Flp family type IVb pilin [Nocardioidaceae bacterium]